MKIGILTLFHDNYNWGGVLQGYALKTLIEKEIPNTQVDILIYKGGKNIIYNNILQQAMQYSVKDIIHKVKQRYVKKRNNLGEELAKRYCLFKDFMNEYTTNEMVYSDFNLQTAAEEYDCLISGSDQVWNPNVGRAGFLQQMIPNHCRKISYAASIARDDLSAHERDIMIPLIEKFHAISVRENTAKTLLKKYMSSEKDVAEVLDPVLMLETTDWNKILEKSEVSSEKYALAFFFSDSYTYRKKIKDYCDLHGLKLKFIPFAKQEYLPSDEQGECERIYDVGPREFVALFKNAQCVFTDSFHGAVFSINFHIPFTVFERDKHTKVSKNSRLYDLLSKFELSNRLVKKIDDLDAIMKQQIDFYRVERLLEQHREESLHFLQEAIGMQQGIEDKVARRVNQLKRIECCGCSLCASVCPQKCISLEEDEEGFLYPKIDETLCVSCGFCMNACKERDKKMKKDVQLKSYIGYHSNEDIRRQSSSGGLFYVLAEHILNKGGSVYGAAFTETFKVEHKRIVAKEELPLLMTSKYVQSAVDSIFALVQRDLQEGRTVLFSGTPCQVAAVRQFIKEKRISGNILLVDFICHGVPSPGIWGTYVQYLEQKMHSPLQYVNFRDKQFGWHDFHFYAKSKKGYIEESHELNVYMRAFLSDRNLRPSCYKCSFKKENYYSDITLADAWKIEKDFPKWADDKGTSLFVVRTKQGRELLAALSEEFICREADYNQWCKYNTSLVAPTAMPTTRQEFFDRYKTKQNTEFWNGFNKPNLKKQVKYCVKKFLKTIGLAKVIRKLV